MITLEKVRKDNNIIEADYYIERDSFDKGHFSYDINSGKMVGRKKSNRELCYGYDVAIKLKKACEIMVTYDKYPETYHYSWY